MSQRTYSTDERPFESRTLTQIFFDAVERFGDKPAYGRFDADLTVQYHSYRDMLGFAKAVAGGLEAQGVTRGQRVGIMSPNRLEWAMVDFGCLCAGVVDVPIYPTLMPAQVAFIVGDSEVRLVFVPDEDHMRKALDAAAESGSDTRVVVFDPPAEVPAGAMSWKDFLAAGEASAEALSDADFRSRALEAGLSDVATMLYTSGTTGNPKGVVLTHGNVGSNVVSSGMVLHLDDTDSTVSFLPLSHIFQRMVDYLFFARGCTIVHARTMLTAIEDMAIVRPTVAVAVPRVYEKVHAAVMEATGVKKRIIDWAVSVADRVVTLRLDGKEASGLLALQFGLADRLVFGKVRAAVGGRMRFFVSGSAPLSADLNRFFYSIGLTILEGYGLTETSPVTNVNSEEHFRIGTVGKVIPGTTVQIAEDGEILVRGPQVMKGYHNRPEETAAAIDPDGWFHTGDIGEIDEDGFLRITDRKKDLIVTAGGKNVAPQPIENRLKGNRFIEQAVVVGDRRRFVSVLVVPAFEVLEQWAHAQGLEWGDRSALLAHDAVQTHMERQVAKELKGLASFETPKKVALLEDDFSIGDGTLTPTLKVKRRVIQDRFVDVIDQLYQGEAPRP